MISDDKQTLTDPLIAIILAGCTLLLLLITAPHIGVTWDEPAYIAAGESYAQWFGELLTDPGYASSQEGIDRYWIVQYEHPPADKVWSGLVWIAARQILPDLAAHRLGNMILSAVLAGLVYLMVAEPYGRRAGLLATGVLFTLPRFFFHAHLASLDVPTTVGIFATVYVFWKTKDKPGWGPTVTLAIVWGLAVATKHNSVFVMPVLFLWVLLFRRGPHLILRLVDVSFLAFLVFVLIWPWLYHDLIYRIVEYVEFMAFSHWEIGQFYLGKVYLPPPWHFTFAMLAAVVPLTYLFAFLAGSTRTLLEKENRPLGVMLLLNTFVPLLVLAFLSSLVYDNERLFMPAFAFLACLSGIGIDWALVGINGWLKKIDRMALQIPAAITLLLVIVVPHLAAAVSLYPHLLSYYSESVGGLRGATRMGFETTYWCETYNEVLDYLNTHAEAGDKVWVDPYSSDVLIYYVSQGQLRDDLVYVVPPLSLSYLDEDVSLIEGNFEEADFLVVHRRESSLETGDPNTAVLPWVKENGYEPDFQYSHRGIILVEVYDLKSR